MKKDNTHDQSETEQRTYGVKLYFQDYFMMYGKAFLPLAHLTRT